MRVTKILKLIRHASWLAFYSINKRPNKNVIKKSYNKNESPFALFNWTKRENKLLIVKKKKSIADSPFFARPREVQALFAGNFKNKRHEKKMGCDSETVIRAVKASESQCRTENFVRQKAANANELSHLLSSTSTNFKVSLFPSCVRARSDLRIVIYETSAKIREGEEHRILKLTGIALRAKASFSSPTPACGFWTNLSWARPLTGSHIPPDTLSLCLPLIAHSLGVFCLCWLCWQLSLSLLTVRGPGIKRDFIAGPVEVLRGPSLSYWNYNNAPLVTGFEAQWGV